MAKFETKNDTSIQAAQAPDSASLWELPQGKWSCTCSNRPLLLKCHFGFSKNDFSRKSDQWRAKRRKNFRIEFVVCQQFTFKIRRFRFTAAQTEAWERMMSKEELTSVVFSCLQELSKPQCKLFKDYPSSFILLQIVQQL